MSRRKKRTKKASRQAEKRGKGDSALFFITLGLVLFGSIMVFSGSVPIATTQDYPPYYYFVRQVIFAILGAIVFVIAYNLNYKIYRKLTPIALVFTLILLVVVLFLPEIQGTHRWVNLGFTTVQVSDIAKLTLVLYLSSWLSKPSHEKQRNQSFAEYFLNSLLPFLMILGLFSGLIILQPDLSTTVLIGIIAISIYFLSGDDRYHTLGTFSIFGLMGIGGIFAAMISSYRLDRILSFGKFLFSGEIEFPYGRDYQLRQILIAVGTGGLLGEGFAQSKQKFSYLTETAFSDTIFAIFAEEFGFFGSIVLVSIFAWIMLRGFRIAKTANDKFGALLAVGITIWITMQAFIHFAVNVGLIPLTGMPLPFVSYGGTSLVMTMSALGILVNISRYSDEFE